MKTSSADFRHCDREPQAKREAIQSGSPRRFAARDDGSVLLLRGAAGDEGSQTDGESGAYSGSLRPCGPRDDEVCSLADLCELITQQVDPANMGVDFCYLGLEHLPSARLRPMTRGRAADVQSHKFVFRKGDVLYGKLRPYFDKAVLADTDGVCTTELLVLHAKNGTDPRFLACVVHSPDFNKHAMSAAIPGVLIYSHLFGKNPRLQAGETSVLSAGFDDVISLKHKPV
jgi:hypothetical protein